MKRPTGFTLIELLIVVAIIAILAAIAVPNFLEAQVRAKVSRVKSDMRTIRGACEAYAVDQGKYPICAPRGDPLYFGSGGTHHLTSLTTPVAYMTTVSMGDPFRPSQQTDWQGWLIAYPYPNPYSYGYASIEYLQETRNLPPHHSMFVIASNGPDYLKGPHPDTGARFGYEAYADGRSDGQTNGRFVRWNYDPTNGTVSSGDIICWQSGMGNP